MTGERLTAEDVDRAAREVVEEGLEPDERNRRLLAFLRTDQRAGELVSLAAAVRRSWPFGWWTLERRTMLRALIDGTVWPTT